MFENGRLDYTQELFRQFVRCTEIRKRFGYMCKDATILTTDDKLFNKLKFHDASKYLMNGNQIYTLEDLGIELYDDTQLAKEIKNAAMFKSYPKDIKDRCDYTYICANNDKAFNRITELLPIVFHHHMSKHKINLELPIKYPTLNVEVSIDNAKKKIYSNSSSNGSYTYAQDYILSRNLVKEIEVAHNHASITM